MNDLGRQGKSDPRQTEDGPAEEIEFLARELNFGRGRTMEAEFRASE